MAETPQKPVKTRREARLAAALRENLRRRKQQERGRAEQTEEGTSAGENRLPRSSSGDEAL